MANPVTFKHKLLDLGHDNTVSSIMDLFEHASDRDERLVPLADRLRPKLLEQFFGHTAILSALPFLKNKAAGRLPHLILWGPPGTGKTTFAGLLSQDVNAEFRAVNAVDIGSKELKELGQEGHRRRVELGQPLILFIDEIHRLNRAQQDVFLSFLEHGDLTLIGATTENPSYELNKALLSRVRVLRFELLKVEDLKSILLQALERLKLPQSSFLPGADLELCQGAQGDARRLLNALEVLVQESAHNQPWSTTAVQQALQTQVFPYDKHQDDHYDTISAFIKSVRGSDPDAAVYYLARMLEGGEDPIFIARRLVILASEDIGNADPRALPLAMAAAQAVELIGLPEAAIHLAHATTYLASTPKSNRSYMALLKAREMVKKYGHLPIPQSLLSAKNAKDGNYIYSQDGPRGFVAQQFLPDALVAEKFYEPHDRAFEKTLKIYLAWIRGENSKDDISP